MDVVLVGLPGSGKSVVGRRLARHGATLIDLDEVIEREAGMSDPGDLRGGRGGRLPAAASGRRSRASAPPDAGPAIAAGRSPRVAGRSSTRGIAGSCSAAAVPVWLDGRPEVLAQRLRRSPNVRPLVAGRDPIGAVRGLASARASGSMRRPSE